MQNYKTYFILHHFGYKNIRFLTIYIFSNVILLIFILIHTSTDIPFWNKIQTNNQAIGGRHTNTNFYFQSVGYVASFLKNEVENAVFC